MASFPGSIFSQTDPVGTNLVATLDHGLQHKNINDEINGLEAWLGSNSASNGVFAGYTAGQTPLPINTGTLGTIIAKGTINNSIMGTPAITGGTFNNGVFGTATLQAPTINGLGTNSGTLTNGVYTNAQFAGSANLAAGTYTNPVFNVWNGWIQANEVPTVLGTLSAQGINIGTLQVAATAANKYDKGDELQFTQNGTTLYAYIYSIPSGTTILATGGTDYVIGTGAITNLQYSKGAHPNGFPEWFNYTSGINYTGTAPTGLVNSIAQFKVDGHEVRFRFHASYGTAGTTSGEFINQPIPSNITGNVFHDPCMGIISSADYTNAPNSTPFECTLAGGTTIQMQSGNAAIKALWMQGNYAI